jgi:Flp pilus assembly protein TadB
MKRRLRSAYRSLPRPLRRVSALLLGMGMLVAGLAMLVLPGPGLLVLGLAVAVLALEFDSARRLAERVSRASRRLAHCLGFSRP